MDSGFPVEVFPRTGGRLHRSAPIGPLILIPGYPQWAWNQTERALVLFGSFATALLVGVMTWGTAAGLGILAFAFATHVFSAVDAIRQNAFPGFGRFVPTVTTSASLGVAIYVPALAMASVYAWPITFEDRPREGFLVNRWAYRSQTPKSGETVWLGKGQRSRPQVAQVVAGPGQRVEWAGGEFRVDGKHLEDPPFATTDAPSELKLTVPARHVFVVYSAASTRGKGSPAGWEFIETSEIRGQAWAQSYPIWSRQLLR